MRDRNFIVELYNNVRETNTNINHEKTFGFTTEKDEGYNECLADISKFIMEYMHMEGNKERFYSNKKATKKSNKNNKLGNLNIMENNEELIRKLSQLEDGARLENEKEINEIRQKIDKNINLCNHVTSTYSTGGGAEVEECGLCGMQKVTWFNDEDGRSGYIQCCDYDYNNFN